MTDPTREQWAAWLNATADHADDLPDKPDREHWRQRADETLYEAGMRDGLRVAAEHLRSEHCASEAVRMWPLLGLPGGPEVLRQVAAEVKR